MENKEIIERLKKVLEEYKERNENESDCSSCEKESESSIRSCLQDTGEEPNDCIDCHRKQRDVENFVEQAMDFLDRIYRKVEKKSDDLVLEPLSPRDVKQYPFDALAVKDYKNPKEIEIVKVIGYSSTVGFAIDVPEKKSIETMYFLRKIYKLSK